LVLYGIEEGRTFDAGEDGLCCWRLLLRMVQTPEALHVPLVFVKGVRSLRHLPFVTSRNATLSRCSSQWICHRERTKRGLGISTALASSVFSARPFRRRIMNRPFRRLLIQILLFFLVCAILYSRLMVSAHQHASPAPSPSLGTGRIALNQRNAIAQQHVHPPRPEGFASRVLRIRAQLGREKEQARDKGGKPRRTVRMENGDKTKVGVEATGSQAVPHPTVTAS
jgi:hypothetical protein